MGFAASSLASLERGSGNPRRACMIASPCTQLLPTPTPVIVYISTVPARTPSAPA
eukprot:NODE_14536_length_235_cov_30.392473_g13623_i0.p4 GENE.NODE_14536_length_235_cov_30.392473_g13623_i0~~NODE_14536_length_235_cov_30.392473_g13623_i0.p4  ORF type:complete len:55 (-),score=9.47 NODE_14536_length_235_cov_30.392473_g13623_i0:44-208(-)